MNPGLVDSIRYVTNAAFSPGDADHTLLTLYANLDDND